MNGQAIFIFFFLAVGIAGLFFVAALVSSAALRAYKENEVDLGDYQQRLEEAQQINRRIKGIVTWRWPIWPRPILFEEVDQSTQFAFASSEQAIRFIWEIDQAILPIPSPSLDLSSTLRFGDNLRRVMARSVNKTRFAEFDRQYLTIVSAEETIHSNRKRVNVLKKQVEQDLGTLINNLQHASNSLPYFQNLGVVRYEDVYQNIETAQRCVDRASEEINGLTQEDMAEWAVASLLCQAGQFAIFIFRMKGKAYSFSENYEADESLAHLAEFTTHISLISEIQETHNWKQLVHVRNQLQIIRRGLERVEDTLIEFDTNVQVLLNYLDRLKAVEFHTLYQRAETAETGLGQYIGSPAEEWHLWVKSLGGQEPPLARMEAQKNEFEQNIQPLFQDFVIRQSQLPVIITALQKHLEIVQKIKQSITRTEKFLQEHQRYQQEVFQRVGEHGQTTLALQKLDDFAHNSTPEIIRSCSEKSKQFQKIIDRAHGSPKNANFPGILSELNAFEKDCKRLVDLHQDEIARLQTQAVKHLRELSSIRNRLTYTKDTPPYVTWDWPDLFANFTLIEQEYEQAGSDYRLLSRFNDRARKFYREALTAHKQILDQHSAFQAQYQKIYQQIKTVDNNLSRYIDRLQEKWNTPLSNEVHLLSQHLQQYRKMGIELQATQGNRTMIEAVQICQAIQERMDETDRQQKEIVSRSGYWMGRLNALKRDIDNLYRDKRLSDRNPQAIAAARKLESDAREADDPEKAKDLLALAKKYLVEAQMSAPPNLQNLSSQIPMLGDQIRGNKADNTSRFQPGQSKGKRR